MNRQVKVVGFEVPKQHMVQENLISSNDLDGSNTAGCPRTDVEKGKSLRVETTNHVEVINPVTWKPYDHRKNADDVYFGGTKNKKLKGKSKSNRHEPEFYNGGEQKNKFWKTSEVKEIFPSPINKEESVDDLTEEIQYLDLEDFQVYKKRVPREISPPRELWKSDDFPGIGNVTRERFADHDVESGATYSLFCLPNLKVLDNENMKHASICCKNEQKLNGISRKRLCHCPKNSQVLQQHKILFSKSSQTDESLSYGNINESCQNLPIDLKEIVQNLLIEQKKNKKIISHLSRLLCKFVQNTHLESMLSSMSSYEDSSNHFYSSEEEHILSILMDENVTSESLSCYSAAEDQKNKA